MCLVVTVWVLSLFLGGALCLLLLVFCVGCVLIVFLRLYLPLLALDSYY